MTFPGAQVRKTGIVVKLPVDVGLPGLQFGTLGARGAGDDGTRPAAAIGVARGRVAVAKDDCDIVVLPFLSLSLNSNMLLSFKRAASAFLSATA
jgi:hypothetical protein